MEIIKHQKNWIQMASIIITTFQVIFFFVLTAAARRPHTFNGRDGMSSINGQEGICSLMARTEGYGCEEHKVTTKDGYILSMQRMPVSKSGKKADKPPVLLQHGLLMDGGTWLLNSPDESLGFILADNGFDVWIANTRGSNFSRGHTSLSPSDPAYWDWSWDELVEYDLPASIQYVHDQTGQKLHYVGHSLVLINKSHIPSVPKKTCSLSNGNIFPGTEEVYDFVQHQTVDMLRSAALLSPIAYLGQMPSPLSRAAADAFLAEDLFWLGIHEFAPRGEAVVKLLEDICKNPDNNCSDLMTSFTGKNCCVNSSMTDIFLQHEPQSTATKNMIHLAQMIRGGKVAKYDYGSAYENNKHYGQDTPPEYKLASIPNNFPLYLGYGGADTLSDVKDVQTLLNILQEHESDKLVAVYTDDYAHADFVFGVNAKQVVYNPLMDFFKLY